MKKHILSLLAASTGAVLFAETFVWTGNGSETDGMLAFTDPANWKLQSTGETATRAPGMVYSVSGEGWEADRAAAWATYDAYSRDEAVFGPVDSGEMQTIDLTGHVCVSNVLFVSGGPAYVFKKNQLGVGIRGTLTVESGVDTLPVFEKGLGLGTGVTKAMGKTDDVRVTLRNDKAGSQLAVPDLGYASAPDTATDVHYAHNFFTGAGGFRIGRVTSAANMPSSNNGKMEQYVHRFFHFRNAGKVSFYKSSSGTVGQWSYIDGYFFGPTDGAGEVEIEAGATVYVQPSGYGGYRFMSDYRIFGAGTFYLNGDKSTTSQAALQASPVLAAEGKTVYLEAPVGYRNHDGHGPNMRFFGKADDAALTGTIDLTALAANGAADSVATHHGLTLKVAGIDGGTSVSNAFGTAPLALSGGATLAYAGPGETTARALYLTNAVGLGYSGSAAACATLAQRGTGAWKITGFVDTATASAATLTLENDSDVPAEFASVLSRNAAGTFETGLRKTGSGLWTLSAVNTSAGELEIAGGTLEVAASGAVDSMQVVLSGGRLAFAAGGGARTVGSLTVDSGVNEVSVAAGTTLTLAEMPVYRGGSLDLTVDAEGAVVFPESQRGRFLPSYIRVNGVAARIDADGSLCAAGEPIVPTAEIAARGSTLPDGADIVGITSAGTQGPVSLSGDTSVGIIVQQTDTPATVSLSPDRTLSAEALAVEEGGADLVIGEDAATGTFVAAGGNFTLENLSETAALTVNAPLSVPAGTLVSKLGAGTARLPSGGDWSATLALAGGSLYVGDLMFSGEDGEVDCGLVVSGERTAVGMTGGGALRLGGNSGAGERVPLEVQSGCITVADGAFIATDSVTVSPADGAAAKLVVTDGATLYFPETNGTFRIGAMSDAPEAAVPELVVSNGTVATVFDPAHGNDFNLFASTTDRAIMVGGSAGDGILRVRDGAAVTNRIVLGEARHRGALYMDGGEIVSLGGDANNGSERYTLLGCGGRQNLWGGGHGYFEQKAGCFTALESLLMAGYDASSVCMMTGGRFRMCAHPAANDEDGSYFTFVFGDGAASLYIGGDADWESMCGAYMVDQGTGQVVLTVDGDARARFAGTQFTLGNNSNESRIKPFIVNVNGGELHWLSPAFRSNTGLDYFFDGTTRVNAHAYLNLDGGRIVYDTTKYHEITPYRTSADYPFFTRFSVYGGGGEIHVTNDYANISCPIEAATGNGVAAVVLDEPLAGFIVAPVVEIEGDGFGASAVALFDSETRMTTNILVTSAGCDYREPPVAKLFVSGTLVKTLPCTLAPNTSGPLTLSGSKNFAVRAPLSVPEVIVNSSGWTMFQTDDCLPAETGLTVAKGTVDFGNAGSTYSSNRPKFIRGAGGGSLRKRPGGIYETQSIPLDGAEGLNWNSQTNLVVGRTVIDCARLVANRAAGIVPANNDRNLSAVVFAPSSSFAFTNVDALDPKVVSYPICRMGTQTSSTQVYTGMPAVEDGLPSRWRLRADRGVLRLSNVNALVVIIR